MKVKQLAAVIALAVSFNAVSTEQSSSDENQNASKAQALLKKDQSNNNNVELEKKLARILIMPCRPYPLCT